MRRTFTLAALAALALTLPALASAKGDLQARICGASACSEDTESGRVLAGGAFFGEGGCPETGCSLGSPPALTPYYRIDFRDGDATAWRRSAYYWVPEAHLLGFVDEWGRNTPPRLAFLPLDASRTALLERAAHGLEPLPPPRITSSTIGERTVTEAASYARLLGLEPTSGLQLGSPDWQPVTLHSAEWSPWTNEPVAQYSPSMRLLWAGATFTRLPEEVARRLQAGAPLADTGGSGDGGIPIMAWLLPSLALLIAAGGLVVLLRPERRGERTAPVV
jgi:hypothetical protein